VSDAGQQDTYLKLLKLAERGRAASPTFVRTRARHPPSAPVGSPPADPRCPLCGEGGRLDAQRFRCLECGVFDSDGRGGWLRRPHCDELACREVLTFAARLLPTLATAVVLRVERQNVIEQLDTRQEPVAASLRQSPGTVARWLEHRGERLLAVEVVE